MTPPNAFSHMKGLASVEVAVIAPVFIGMLLAVIEFGVLLYDKALITNASLQLAQVAATMTTNRNSLNSPPTPTELQKIKSFVESAAAMNTVIGSGGLSSLDGSSLPVARQLPLPWDNNGWPLQVTVEYKCQCQVLASLMNLFSSKNLAGGITLSTTTSVYLN